MRWDCESMLRLAQSHDLQYESFTSLQESAFQSREAYDYDQDLFIIGETSSGKTLIPMLLYEAALETAEEQGDDIPKMLFVVPYRALASQKLKEIEQFFSGRDLKIVQSTGEFRQDDDILQSGQVDIGVIIPEKAYKYEARDAAFLSKYDYLVLDEVGLLSNPERGVHMDFILAWAKSQKSRTGRPRTIALGTPFYDWSAYINSYRFHAIQTENSRPVELEETAIVYTGDGIHEVEGADSSFHRVRMVTPNYLYKQRIRCAKGNLGAPGSKCEYLYGKICPLQKPCRSDPSLVCDVTGEPCRNQVEFLPSGGNAFWIILLRICRKHLEANRQILIFVNDRSRVKEYCRFLYEGLQDLLPPAPPAEECKRQILTEYGLRSDDVYGIMESDEDDGATYYQSFARGIGFHSTELPNELRSYVEEKFLQEREMKIVCSTETLAFGVNSAVDVVVIADLNKYEAAETRTLSLNEYRNYIGRAGRLRRDVPKEDRKGYVYTLVRLSQKAKWQELKKSAEAPEQIYSLFHTEQREKMPFFLLNLLPVSERDGITPEELDNITQTLPHAGCDPEVLRGEIREALEYLVEQGLAMRTGDSAARRTPGREKYCLTVQGMQLRGYILDKSDYCALLRTMEEYVKTPFRKADTTAFLYCLLRTKQAEKGLNSVFANSDYHGDLNLLRAYIRKVSGGGPTSMEWLDNCKKDRVLSVLAAVLAWGNGESTKMLYRQFGIHYALLDRVTNQLSYLIEIAAAILPSCMERLRMEGGYRWLDAESFQEKIDSRNRSMWTLFASVYFGLNAGVCTRIRDYLASRAESGDPAAAELAHKLAPERMDPEAARLLRRIAIRWRFFAEHPKTVWSSVEERNNYRNQRWQYKKDVEEMGPCVSGFFREEFGASYEDA